MVFLKYVVVFVVLVVGIFYIVKLYLFEEFGKSYIIVMVFKGQCVKIELFDGIIVWLSFCSCFCFVVFFNEMDCKIELDGVIYFDVVKNFEKLFVVLVKGYCI